MLIKENLWCAVLLFNCQTPQIYLKISYIGRGIFFFYQSLLKFFSVSLLESICTCTCIQSIDIFTNVGV